MSFGMTDSAHFEEMKGIFKVEDDTVEKDLNSKRFLMICLMMIPTLFLRI